VALKAPKVDRFRRSARSSRLGLTWANGVWLGVCPQVKRA
jgi:hypothetical protein